MIPLYTSGQIRQFDRKLISETGVPSIVLMENAARNIYDICVDEFQLEPAADVIGIVCGKGNNAGDGFALARHFLNFGFRVILLSVYDPKDFSPDCLTNYSILTKDSSLSQNLQLIHYSGLQDINKLKSSSLIIEALLGSGSKDCPSDFLADIIKKINQIPCRKVSIDIPAGLDSDRGYVYRDSTTGEAIVFRSDLTVSLAAYKRGLFFNDGYLFAGKVVATDIGVNFSEGAYPSEDFLIEAEDCYYSLPISRKNAYKYTSGKLLIAAGSITYPGAAVLAATAALKTGCGSVHLAVPESAYSHVISLLQKPEIVVHRIPDNAGGTFCGAGVDRFISLAAEYDAVLCGPGITVSADTTEFVNALALQRIPTVFDADALTILGKDLNSYNLNNTILTPHPGEFSKLLGKPLQKIRENILEYGKIFAEENGALVIFKDFRTVIFNNNGESFINTTGNEGLAKIGSGDVLAGLTAGFYAQTGDRERSAICAVYLHGLTGDILSEERTVFAYSCSELITNFHLAVNLIKGSVDS